MKRLIVSFCLVAIVATACADVTQPALEVNGETIGRSEMLELIEDLRSPASGTDPVRVGSPDDAEGCFARDLAVNQSILDILARDEIGRLGGSIIAEDLELARGVAEVEIVDRGRFTEDARPFIEDVVSSQTALGRLVPSEDVGQTFQRLIEEADVVIDSRFGRWVLELGGLVSVGTCAGV